MSGASYKGHFADYSLARFPTPNNGASWIEPQVVADAIKYVTKVWEDDIVSICLGWQYWYQCIQEAMAYAELKQGNVLRLDSRWLRVR